MKKHSGGLIAGIIVFIACIVGLFLVGGIASAVPRIIVTVAIIIVMLLIAIIGILVFANKAGQSDSKKSSGSKKELTPEQSESLSTARSQLTDIRMTLSRVKDSSIGSAGNEACSAIEKVLQTLKEKPEKIQTTRQLFNYYLPTLGKVISKYQRIEASGVENAEMPSKLKNYLSDVKSAMDNLYEGLYDNDKLNVEVDMEAMTMAIQRDGLLEAEDFN